MNTQERRALKKKARRVVKTHYVLLILLCLLVSYLGVEFTSTTDYLQGFQEMVTSDIADSHGPMPHLTAQDVWDDIAAGNFSEGEDTSKKIIQDYEEGEDEGKVVGRSNGVLAGLVNKFSAGRIYVVMAQGIRTMVHSAEGASIVFVSLSTLLYLCFWIFFLNILRVLMRRIFMESRLYKDVPLGRLGYLAGTRQWGRVALGLLRCHVYLFLWRLTVIGGFIKVFSYFCVPYILAENPSMKGKDAILLSRRMMDGHKLELFKYSLTFWYWYILGVLTVGVSDVIYFIPYVTAARTEYYARLRKQAKESHLPLAENLHDDCLFEKAEDQELATAYTDVLEKKNALDEEALALTGIRRFFTKYLGLWIGTIQEKRIYQAQENQRFQLRREYAAAMGDTYPLRLSPLELKVKVRRAGRHNYLRCYTLWSLLLLFFVFSFVGWCWEVSIHLIEDGVFVNRGVLHGPWLPIYGSGGVVALLLLTRLRKSIAAEFFGAMVLSGILEYTTSYVLEKTHDGMRWWDYSGYFLNLDGRICLEGLLVFGLACLLVVYLIAPALDTRFERIPGRFIVSLAVCLLVIFAADNGYSSYHPNEGKGITDYDRGQERSMVVAVEIKKVSLL